MRQGFESLHARMLDSRLSEVGRLARLLCMTDELHGLAFYIDQLLAGVRPKDALVIVEVLRLRAVERFLAAPTEPAARAEPS
jgi:hypothetical protein